MLANAISNPPGSRPCDRGGSCGVAGLIAVAQATQGSVENLKEMRTGTLESSLSQADIAFWAHQGIGPYKGQPAFEQLTVDRQPLHRDGACRGPGRKRYPEHRRPARQGGLGRRGRLRHAGRGARDPGGLRPQREGHAGALPEARSRRRPAGRARYRRLLHRRRPSRRGRGGSRRADPRQAAVVRRSAWQEPEGAPALLHRNR